MSEAIVPKVGHGPKMGKTDLTAHVFLEFSYSFCFIAYSYEANNGGTDMEVLACFRPGFLLHELRQTANTKIQMKKKYTSAILSSLSALF